MSFPQYFVNPEVQQRIVGTEFKYWVQILLITWNKFTGSKCVIHFQSERMDITEAKAYANQTIMLGWTDRNGEVINETVHVLDVNFVPFYGPCFITSNGDIRLDRVVSCSYINSAAA